MRSVPFFRFPDGHHASFIDAQSLSRNKTRKHHGRRLKIGSKHPERNRHWFDVIVACLVELGRTTGSRKTTDHIPCVERSCGEARTTSLCCVGLRTTFLRTCALLFVTSLTAYRVCRMRRRRPHAASYGSAGPRIAFLALGSDHGLGCTPPAA